MSESTANTADESITDDERLEVRNEIIEPKAPIVDAEAVRSPSDQGLNLLAEAEPVSKRKHSHRGSTAAGKSHKKSPVAVATPRKSRNLLTWLTVLSCLIIGGVIAWTAKRSPVANELETEVADGLDLSEIGEQPVAANEPLEPRRVFDTSGEEHPFLRQSSGNRFRTDWDENDRQPVYGNGSGVIPAANFVSDSGTVAQPPQRVPASGTQGAYLTGVIEPSDISVSYPAPIPANSASRPISTRPRHPLAD